MKRALLAPGRLDHLRGPMGGGRMLTAVECRELADAYELAVTLLERVVRESDDPSRNAVDAKDVAWIALRDAAAIRKGHG